MEYISNSAVGGRHCTPQNYLNEFWRKNVINMECIALNALRCDFRKGVKPMNRDQIVLNETDQARSHHRLPHFNTATISCPTFILHLYMTQRTCWRSSDTNGCISECRRDTYKRIELILYVPVISLIQWEHKLYATQRMDVIKIMRPIRTAIRRRFQLLQAAEAVFTIVIYVHCTFSDTLVTDQATIDITEWRSVTFSKCIWGHQTKI